MTRRCPRCSYLLENMGGDAVGVEHCERCGGTFLDRKKTIEQLGGLASPQRWQQSHVARPVDGKRLSCACGQSQMIRYHLSVEKLEVEVDHCPLCEGLWLDRGEGATLRTIVEDEDCAKDLAQYDAGGVKTYLFQLFTGLPREVYNPIKRRAWLLYALMLVLTGTLAVEMLLPEARWLPLALVPAELWQGRQVWGLLSYALLHASIAHLLGNLYFLWIFGDNIEDRLGRRGLLVVLIAASMVGGLLEASLNAGSTIPILGASGAVAGAMGAYLKLFPGVRLWVVFFFVRFKVHVGLYLGLWVGFQLISATLGVTGVAWYAHLGGFAAGFLMAVLLPRARSK